MMDVPRTVLILVLAAPVVAAQPLGPESEQPGAEALPEPVIPEAGPRQPAPGDEPREAMALDALFKALADAGPEAAEPIQRKIMAEWARNDSDAMTLLLARATEAMKEEELDHALGFLDDLVRLAPDYAEAWNRRATVHFQREDFGRAVSDIARTLALEPRHFGALTGLGVIMERLGREEAALAAFHRALDINPHLEAARKAVDRLKPEVEGRPL